MTTQLEQAARQGLEVLESEVVSADKYTKTITALRAALTDAALKRMVENERELGIQMQPAQDDVEQSSTQSKETFDQPVAHSIVAGALFDFMGWLTSRKERLVLSSVDDASSAVEVIRQFSKMRCLSLDEANVQKWQEHLYTRPQPVPTSDTSQDRVDETEKQRHEPKAWMHNYIEGNVITHRPADLDRNPDRWTALYSEPKTCQTCESLARTVMLDQTSYDTRPQAREPLTDEQIEDEWERLTGHSIFGGDRAEGRAMYLSPDEVTEFARAIEAAHGIGEKK